VAPGTIPISALPGGLTRQQNHASLSVTTASATQSYLPQPETRPISQEQLVAEVKGIYAGLVMVEGKCIQVDAKQAQLARDAPEGQLPKLTDDQWQALIALHRTLLHEHHDFFLASQHPSATPAVRNLALKYAMPARLWRHAIHSFLELLRNRLPDSLDHMLAFAYLAYSMMTLLYETVDVFEETWIECLGDLGRYRMAIEDDDIRDKEVWTQVSRQWYLKASGKNPQIGRLYHHLAILARPNAFQQLFYYTKSLSVSQPFPAAKESILTLFEPVLKGNQARKMTPVTIAYIKAHAILFMGNTLEGFGEASSEFIGLLDSHISRCTQRFLEMGYLIAVANCLALLAYGSSSSILAKALSGTEETVGDVDVEMGDAAAQGRPSEATKFANARNLFVQSVDINCQRVGDPNILSFLHVTMIFMVYLSRSPAALQLLSEHFPWASLVTMLNGLARFYHTYPRIENDDIPILEKNDARPTPEEFALRGLDFAEFYLPAGWFENPNIEDENMSKEDPSMNTDYRPERILWLGRQLANRCREITYVSTEHKFVVSEAPKSEPSTTKVTHETDSEVDSTADSATLAADSEVMSLGSSMDYQASTRPVVGSDTHDDDRMDTEENSARDSGE
jgi:hypothetical protein